MIEALLICASAIFGIMAGMNIFIYLASDAAINPNPPAWWRRALIDAHARRNKENVK